MINPAQVELITARRMIEWRDYLGSQTATPFLMIAVRHNPENAGDCFLCTPENVAAAEVVKMLKIALSWIEPGDAERKVVDL